MIFSSLNNRDDDNFRFFVAQNILLKEFYEFYEVLKIIRNSSAVFYFFFSFLLNCIFYSFGENEEFFSFDSEK